jgi:hypothetical protein
MALAIGRSRGFKSENVPLEVPERERNTIQHCRLAATVLGHEQRKARVEVERDRLEPAKVSQVQAFQKGLAVNHGERSLPCGVKNSSLKFTHQFASMGYAMETPQTQLRLAHAVGAIAQLFRQPAEFS